MDEASGKEEITFRLNSPITEEQWDAITDVDFEYTDRIWFSTKHGKEVEFIKRKKGKWIYVNGHTAINCSACYHCGWSLSFEDTVKRFNFCPSCGADMRGEQE